MNLVTMTKIITKDDAMKRFMAAKKKKQERVAELEARLREKYKERTGEYPKYVFSL